MSLNAVPFSTENGGPSQGGALGSVPGKVFILGEYAVLSGSPALLATLGPRFRVKSGGRSEFHPMSPAGRLLAHTRGRGIADPELQFEDPFQGEGGFGASTAQFALLYARLAREAGWELSALGARRVYRELMAHEPLPPSGADLVAQWSGGVVCFDPNRGTVLPHFRTIDWRQLLVFSAAGQAGRKVPTHEHLAVLARNPVHVSGVSNLLDRVLDRGLRAVTDADAAGLGRAMNEYAAELSHAGLELEAARADREALAVIPGVLGVKGTGALLADAVTVLLEPASASRSRVIEAAQARGLRLVADGLGSEPQAGVICAE